MNKGKTCVSVCAETADQLQKKAAHAGLSADLVELRIDCLNSGEIEKLSLPASNKYILTYRPQEQGGRRNLSLAEREKFWNAGNLAWGADFEEDAVKYAPQANYQTTIGSYHDFDRSPTDLIEIYERLKAAGTDVIKIAVQADDITDAIPVWQLLARAKSDHKQIIPIAMGEAGKWTRILGLAYGSFMTYAAPEEGNETAPGQISARDLIENYRIKELNEETEVYGVLGSNTSYSLSPPMHNAAFKHHNLNAVFVPLQVKNLDEFIRRMVCPETREIDLNFRGFSVTIPHKQAIIKHLDKIDEAAREIGAVNTVKIINGKLHGYNTDAHGFIEPLLNFYGDLKDVKVAILGAGGAARACIYALKKESAEVTIFARDAKKAETLAEEFKVKSAEHRVQSDRYKGFDILVNTTPLGTKDKLENESIVTAEQIESVKLVYDLVYNPFQTRLMMEADKVYVPKIGGMAMLVAQGAEQFRIWTGEIAPIKKMSQIVLKKLN